MQNRSIKLTLRCWKLCGRFILCIQIPNVLHQIQKHVVIFFPIPFFLAPSLCVSRLKSIEILSSKAIEPSVREHNLIFNVWIRIQFNLIRFEGCLHQITLLLQQHLPVFMSPTNSILIKHTELQSTRERNCHWC